MATLPVTAANVLKGSGSTVQKFTAGVAMTAGQYVYDAGSGVVQLSDADGSSAAQDVDGVTANDAAAGQPINVIVPNPEIAITTGFTASAIGVPIYLAPTAGAATETAADVQSGDRVILLGVMQTTTTMKFQPIISGVKA